MSERERTQQRDSRVDQPTERFEPPTGRFDQPTERFDPATEGWDPPTERFDSPTERFDSPTERFGPPTERMEPPPLVWADPQRPPLLHTATPAGAGSPGARNARILAFGGMAVLVVVAIAIIISNSGGSGGSKPVRRTAAARHAHQGHAKAAATASAATKTKASKRAATSATTTSVPTATTGAPATSSTASTTAGSTPTTTAASSSSTTAAPSGTAASDTTAFTNAHLSAAVPAGWSVIENDLPKGSFTETKWQNPAVGSTLLVDYQPASGASPQGEGAPVRRAVKKQPGYSEVGWGPGDLSGKQSWKWTFSLPSQGESVDYFFTECGTDYAVLGTAPPGQFNALAGRFRAFAASVKHC